MKIWITRDSAGSVQAGGLERLSVWFCKPQWVSKWWEEDNLPWPSSDLRGRLEEGWRAHPIGSSISFGKMFGYCDRNDAGEDGISEHVWDKLCEHFGHNRLREWEDTGIVHRSNFLVEIEISVSLK